MKNIIKVKVRDKRPLSIITHYSPNWRKLKKEVKLMPNKRKEHTQRRKID